MWYQRTAEFLAAGSKSIYPSLRSLLGQKATYAPSSSARSVWSYPVSCLDTLEASSRPSTAPLLAFACRSARQPYYQAKFGLIPYFDRTICYNLSYPEGCHKRCHPQMTSESSTLNFEHSWRYKVFGWQKKADFSLSHWLARAPRQNLWSLEMSVAAATIRSSWTMVKLKAVFLLWMIEAISLFEAN